MEHQAPISKPETASQTEGVVGVDVPRLVRLLVCCRCGSEIVGRKMPPPCHINRTACDKCKTNASRKRKNAWKYRHPEYVKAERVNPRYRKKIVEWGLRQNMESQRKATQSRERWGPVEECWLLDHAGKMSEKELAENLGRSIRAIEARLWRLRKQDDSLPNK